ncbi:MAG: type II and III secretion system protein [Verrucomicrobiaceae bacterium]|nr:type II and III secretion system protein [Verrucomicrobiaceae bacterium]
MPLKAGPGGASADVPGGIAGVAAAEAQQRQQRVRAAQTLFTSGSRALADKSYGEAMDYFKAAFETIPAVPAVADQREIFFQRYQESAFQYAVLLADEARWEESEKTLTDVIALAEAGRIEDDRVDRRVRTMLEDLRNHDDRYNMATTPQHLRNVNLVESKLILAMGYLELGDYDRAERSYNEVLAADPFNTAARRGLENVERHRMNYFDTALDHTRARKIAEVMAAWETPVPPLLLGDDAVINADGVTDGGSTRIEQKMKEIIIPSLEFSGAALEDVVEFLSQKSQELDASETDPRKRGVNIVIDSSGMGEGSNPAQAPLSVRLSNVPLGVALKYVAQQVGMAYRIDNVAVSVVSPAAAGGGGLMTRRFVVPPGFLSGGGGGGGDAAPADPFATPAADAGGGALVERVTAEGFLQNRGVEFGEGASATYISATSTLIVRNTPDQISMIEYIIQSARDSGPKLVQIHVKMVSVESEGLRQAGLDWLLGQANFGSSPRAFFGGGTSGNADIPVSGMNFPFNGPAGPIGTYPVTAGLRTGDLGGTDGIDNVINRSSAASGNMQAPGVFSVAGVFTDPQFQVVLRALSQMKGTDLLSDAHVLVKSGNVASIEQVREFIYPTEYDPPEIPNSLGIVTIGNTQIIGDVPPEFPATPATPTAFETRKVGKSIEVEPTVSSDNQTVSLNVLLDFSEFSGFINYGTPILNTNFMVNGNPSVVTPNEILMPVFDAIKETTNVSVWDGQTVAIGGFHGESVTDSEDKIPYIGDLPVLGRAFRSSTSQSTKRALTIFVTVRLVDPGGNPIHLPLEEEEPELMTQSVPAPLGGIPAGPPPGMVYPAK